jgi:AraC family transcriptional regulator
MVCNRCVLVVRQEMERLGLHPESVVLGEVTLNNDDLSPEDLKRIDDSLLEFGFERIDDRKGRLVEAIKSQVIRMIQQPAPGERKMNWSAILSENLHYDYNYLSNLFSVLEGTTLEQYIIRQKIERAKELLFYDELNLSQIASELGYSSVAHLSSQFKKVTGFTPSELKKNRDKNETRKSIDAV